MDAHQLRIAGALNDEVVEVNVLVDVSRLVIPAKQFLGAANARPQLLDQLRRDRNQFRGECFHSLAQTVKICDLLGGEPVDKGSAARLDAQQAFALQGVQRLAHG